MSKYKLSNSAKEDLIRIHHFGVENFGITPADNYVESFFDCFEIIAKNPFSFESVDYIKSGYRRCPCDSDAIYYRIKDNIVEIMAIVGIQDLQKIL